MKITQREHFYNIHGRKLCAVIMEPESTKEDTVTLLAIHGWMDNAASFTALMAALPQYRWIALEMVGHGHSDHHPNGVAYHFVDYITDTYQVLRQVASEFSGPLFIIGHSLGAGISACITPMTPELLKGTIFLEGLGPQTDAPEKLLDNLTKAAETSIRFQSQGQVPNHRIVATLDFLIEHRMQAGADLSEAMSRALVERASLKNVAGYRFLTDRALNAPSPFRLSEEHVLELIKRIQTPGLLITAEYGMLRIFPGMKRRVEAYPDLKTVELPGGHHFHMEESVVSIAELVADFVQTQVR